MANKRVRVGSKYVFDPVLFDRLNPPVNGANRGDVVEVVNLPGAPKANTMGMCYIAKGGRFVGMVMTNSLGDILKPGATVVLNGKGGAEGLDGEQATITQVHVRDSLRYEVKTAGGNELTVGLDEIA